MYWVISEPPVDGATQLIVTLTFVLTVVVGAAGASGTPAALISTTDESGPEPTEFRAETLKEYTAPAVRSVAV